MGSKTVAPRGLFIALEGLDGAGTTTQAERLGNRVRERGLIPLVTKEPSDGPIGVVIRQALSGRTRLPDGEAWSVATLALLFAADRLDHLSAEIDPGLKAGKVVISDRYLLSSLAYQGAEAPIDWIEAINAEASSPDLTLFLEVDPKVAALRRASRGGRPELFEHPAIQRKVAERYQQAILRRQRQERIVRLDGSGPVEEVTEKAWSEIASLLDAPRGARKGAQAR